MRVIAENITDYPPVGGQAFGNFVYQDEELSYILTPEGRITMHNSLDNSINSITFNYLYNGKELQPNFGLDWYEYGFRMYDAQTGRFPSLDPKADAFAFVSPYNYAENSPIAFIDLWGLQKAWPSVPYINKFEYNNDPVTNTAAAIDNGAINVANGGISVVNSLLLTGESIQNNGLSSTVNAIGNDIAQSAQATVNNAVNAVDYLASTPVNQMASDLVSPQGIEAISTIAIGATVGKMTQTAGTKANTKTPPVALNASTINGDFNIVIQSTKGGKNISTTKNKLSIKGNNNIAVQNTNTFGSINITTPYSFSTYNLTRSTTKIRRNAKALKNIGKINGSNNVFIQDSRFNSVKINNTRIK